MGIKDPAFWVIVASSCAGIRTTLFSTTAVLDYLARLRDGARVLAADAHDALALPYRLSTVTMDPASGTVRMHSLIQRVEPEQEPAGEAALAAFTAADGPLAIWPEQPQSDSDDQALHANALALFAFHGYLPRRARTGVHPVPLRASSSLGPSVLVLAAGHLHGVRIAATVRHLCEAHLDTPAVRTHFDEWQPVVPGGLELKRHVLGRPR
ncbi:hypothetical protein ACLQ2S_24715 [Micromonospora sp. DT48]|uniref:hypothetical protein n=1 Tax=Micromonospora sp. DT48 TaxID=3393429 RepID=UPI003CF489BD